MKIKRVASLWMIFLSALFGSVCVFACPKSAPDGFLASPNQSTGTYNNKDKSIVLVVKCSTEPKPQDVSSSLTVMGEVHVVSKTISYVDVTIGAMRIYVNAKSEITQIAVVSKSPEALEKVSPALIKYLENN